MDLIEENGMICQHTPAPESYTHWHAWAEKMTKTHKQVRCQHCGLLAIWVPKFKRLDRVLATPTTPPTTELKA